MSTVNVDRTKPRQYGDEAGRYFSVSQVCDVITGGHAWTDQAAMDRGTALHRLFALTVAAYAGLCDAPIVLPEYEGYHRSMMLFVELAKPDPIDIEQKAVSIIKGMPFAGTRDLFYRGSDNRKAVRVLLDLKSGQKEWWHRIQVQAYGKLCPDADRLAVLYINKDGTMPTFQIVKPSQRDWALFQNALSVLIGRESK